MGRLDGTGTEVVAFSKVQVIVRMLPAAAVTVHEAMGPVSDGFTPVWVYPVDSVMRFSSLRSRRRILGSSVLHSLSEGAVTVAS